MAAGWRTQVRSRTDCRDSCVARDGCKKVATRDVRATVFGSRSQTERWLECGVQFSPALVRMTDCIAPLRVSHCLAVCDAFNFNPSPAAIDLNFPSRSAVSGMLPMCTLGGSTPLPLVYENNGVAGAWTPKS